MVVTQKEEPVLQAISRLDRERAISIKANVGAGHSQQEAMNKVYERASQSASAVIDEMEKETGDEENLDLQLAPDLVDDPNQAPIIKFVNSLLSQAIKDRASDIHIEPFEKDLSVRFRIDGVLYEIVQPPASSRRRSSAASRSWPA